MKSEITQVLEIPENGYQKKTICSLLMRPQCRMIDPLMILVPKFPWFVMWVKTQLASFC